MRIPRLYTTVALQIGQNIELDETSFQHAIKVLRLKTENEIFLFDGKGNEYRAKLSSVEKKKAYVIITKRIEKKPESNLTIHLALAISKGERMDFAIQKAVELGVTEITPLHTQRCVVNLDAKRAQKKHQHWQSVIISACEQSGRNILPVLHQATALTAWHPDHNSLALVLNPLSQRRLKTTGKTQNITLLIGPEGGLSADEILFVCQHKNFIDIQFGPRILRTETAAIAAIAALQTLWGDIA